MPDRRPTRCRCETRWVVDFGDVRGEQPTTSLTAAMASGLRFAVRLADVSSSPVRPIVLPGVTYGSDTTYVAELCPTCGWPTVMAREETHA